MSKKNEDSVERFFRKAVEQHDDTFMHRDWQKMEKMLDAEAAKATVAKIQRLKKAIFRGAVVTGIITVVYFLVVDQTHPESRLITDALAKKQAVAGAEAPTTEPRTENPSTAALFPENNPNDKPQQPYSSTQERASKYNVEKNVTHNEPVSTSKQSSRKEQLVKPEPLAAGDDAQQLSQSLPHFSAQRQSNPELPANNTVEEESNPIIKEETTKAESLKEEVVAPVQPENTSGENEEEQDEYFSRWNVAVKLAPDFSTTSLNRYSAPGSAFGISIGFNITSRLAINTGVIRSFKKYEGYGGDYSPPPGYWERRTNGIVPDEVSGNCHILEFPVNLQFQLNTSKQNRFFASAGITSYYMMDEAYQYKFDQPNPGAAKSWSSDEPSSYAFSIGMLSAAYERQLTPNVAIGIEPFLKIPFAGIGWTNINLFTTGAYFNLRYRFINKNHALEARKAN